MPAASIIRTSTVDLFDDPRVARALRNLATPTLALFDIVRSMEAARKITVEVPLALLEKAQQASGTGVTHTVRAGLQFVAASQAYARVRQFRGKVLFGCTVAELKADRASRSIQPMSRVLRRDEGEDVRHE